MQVKYYLSNAFKRAILAYVYLYLQTVRTMKNDYHEILSAGVSNPGTAGKAR